MLSYRSHIHSLAEDVTSEGTSFMLHYTNTYQHEGRLPEYRLYAARLREKITLLIDSLPKEVKADDVRKPELGWVNWSLESEANVPYLPGNLLDIIKRDTPNLMKSFDEWYEKQSPIDTELSKELNKHISKGEMDTALREAWPVFKTRTTEKFGLDEKLDGHALVEALFGTNGATVNLFPDNGQREGYRNLFKGLYALYRNPVSHNSDVQHSPAEAEAVLAIVNSVLVKME